MRAHDLQRQPFAVRREIKVLPARDDEFLRLHSTGQRDDCRIGQAERPSQRRHRRVPAAIFLIEQVLQRVLEPPAIASRPLGPPPDKQRRGRGNEREDKKIDHELAVAKS